MRYFVIVLILCACARAPDSIPAADYPRFAVAMVPCETIDSEISKSRDYLAKISATQLATRRRDKWGVAILGLPIGRLSRGDRAQEIANTKGRIKALERKRKSECS